MHPYFSNASELKVGPTPPAAMKDGCLGAQLTGLCSLPGSRQSPKGQCCTWDCHAEQMDVKCRVQKGE